MEELPHKFRSDTTFMNLFNLEESGKSQSWLGTQTSAQSPFRNKFKAKF